MPMRARHTHSLSIVIVLPHRPPPLSPRLPILRFPHTAACRHCCYASSARTPSKRRRLVDHRFVTSPAVVSCCCPAPPRRPGRRCQLLLRPVVGGYIGGGAIASPGLPLFSSWGGPSEHAQFSLDPGDAPAAVPARNHAKVACSCCRIIREAASMLGARMIVAAASKSEKRRAKHRTRTRHCCFPTHGPG
jgi:hypothetical protein